MNTQYTPSHWINDGTEVSACVDPAAGRSYIAPICSLDTDWHPDIVAANARLIAAAPELLAALEWAVDRLDDDPDPDYSAALDAARAVIAKAKGETE
jgi:hypothetical protein